MYKTVKTQTNLPVKICHLKVYIMQMTMAGYEWIDCDGCNQWFKLECTADN